MPGRKTDVNDAAWIADLLAHGLIRASFVPEPEIQELRYFQAQFRRLKSRHGPKKAICAVAASMLTAIYHMLKNGTAYHDLGADHCDRRSRRSNTARLVKRLATLGYAVQITPLPLAE